MIGVLRVNLKYAVNELVLVGNRGDLLRTSVQCSDRRSGSHGPLARERGGKAYLPDSITVVETGNPQSNGVRACELSLDDGIEGITGDGGTKREIVRMMLLDGDCPLEQDGCLEDEK
jgi:hypothetical protein